MSSFEYSFMRWDSSPDISRAGPGVARLKEKIILAAFVLVLLYNEFVLPWVYAHDWDYDPLGCQQQPDCVRVLALADPQLQGFNDEPPGIVGWITRKDADRYIGNAFSMAVSRLKPSAVVVLGDLIDEGYVGTEPQMTTYYGRFHTLFRTQTPLVLLAGDNDIGGEGREGQTEGHLRRFEQWAGVPVNTVVDHEGITFVAINTMALQAGTPAAIADSTVTFIQSLGSTNQSALTVGRTAGNPVVLLAHYPLEYIPASAKQLLLENVRPDFILTGHMHEYALTQHKFGPREITEVTVPTMSYRMGTPRIGFIAVSISRSANKMWARLCRLPPRYTSLGFYGAWAVGSLLFMYVPALARRCGCHTQTRRPGWRDRRPSF